MSSINPTASSTETTRVSGLVSGLDTDSMVEELMDAEGTKLDSIKKEQQLLEWKQEGYLEINTAVLAARTALFDLCLKDTFNTNTVTSSDSSVLTATANTSASDGLYTVNVISLASGATVASTESMASEEDTTTLATQFGLSGELSFTLSGSNGSQTFTFDADTDSLDDVIDQINDAELGFTVSYDEGVDRVFLTTDSTGSSAVIDISDDSSAFLRDTLKLYSGDLATEEVPVNLGTGTDAEIEYNGITGLTYSSNQFNLNNITFNLTRTGETTVTVANDTDGLVEKITAFVEAYNEAIDLIGSTLKEERDYDYGPLTDAEKEEMTDEQIELWEEKARSGLLKRDLLLRGIYRGLRSLITDNVDGLSEDNIYTSLSAIGIATGSDYEENGKLYIDEDALVEALADDPEGVMELFTGTSNNGLARSVLDKMDAAMTNITNRAGDSVTDDADSYLGGLIDGLDEDIEDMQDYLKEREEKYWDMFTAMEEALAQLASQSEYISSVLSSLSA